MDRESIASIARKRGESLSSPLHLQLYCRNTECAAREIDVRLKDHDFTLLRMVTRRNSSCPICAEPLTFHWIRSAAEQNEEVEYLSRVSVNQQVWRRDHADKEGICLINLADLDDSLPGDTSFEAQARDLVALDEAESR